MISANEYAAFQRAYDYFNTELFAGVLPPAFITLHRHKGARGYFAPERFNARAGDANAHEIALNPDTFSDRTDAEILSTLAHEMCHHWQQSCGRPPRKCYHDRQWAAKMKEIGLQPTTTGDASGKETGAKVTHMIVAGGRFDVAVRRLIADGFRLSWQSDAEWGNDREKKAASKTKFTCPECEQNAWGKPDTLLICGVCYEETEDAVVMLAAA